MILHGLLDFDDDCIVMYATILGVRPFRDLTIGGPSASGDVYQTEIITIGGESFYTKMTLPQVRKRLLEAEQEHSSPLSREPFHGEGH